MEKETDIDPEKESVKKEYCLNCGAELTGLYCSNCGQKKQRKRQTLYELIFDFFSSFTSFESKFFQTLIYLLFKPGFLPVEYINGKRARYYHPARAYVFVSFLFFLAFFSLPGSRTGNLNFSGITDTKRQDSLSKGIIHINTASRDSLDSRDDSVLNNLVKKYMYHDLAEYDSVQNTLSPDQRDNWFKRMMHRRQIEVRAKYKGHTGEFMNMLKQSYIENFPKVFFLLLPLFALILKLLYLRRDFYYSEHLIFSIYFYDFFFVTGTMGLLLSLLPWDPEGKTIIFILVCIYLFLAGKSHLKKVRFKKVLIFLLITGAMVFSYISLPWLYGVKTSIFLWLVIYLLLGMKRMYRQDWGKTLIKFLLLGFLFLISMSIVLLGNLFVTFLFAI